MVSILAIGIAARLGDEQVLSSILRERPSVIVQYWTRGKKTTDVGVNHLVCVSSTGKASPEQNPIQSFSGLKISPDFSYIACSRQVAAPPDEKRDYITEIPPYNTNVQIASATQVLFKKTFHAATSIFWIGQNLHTDPDMGTTISQMEKTAPWIESKVNVPPVARRTFAQPESNGDYFSFQPDRSLPIFYYHSEGRVKTCRLNSQSPSQLMSLTGTPDFLYIDGFGGGVYILNGITGVSQKTLIRHFE